MEVNMKLLVFAALVPLISCFAAVPDGAALPAEPESAVMAPLAAGSGDVLSARITAASKASFQNSGAAPGQTGAAPARKTKKRSETKTFLWVMGGIAAAALAIGLTAAAQGKSPF